MAIPFPSTFNYEATVPQGATSPTEVVLEGRQRDPSSEGRLLGRRPRITLRDENIILSTQQPSEARVWYASYRVGEAVRRTLQGGDRLHLVWTETPGFGVSVLRQGTLVLAVGSVTALDLGRGMRVTSWPDRGSGGRAGLASEAGLEFEVGDQHVKLRARHAERLGDYRIYVERIPADPIDVEECVAIAPIDDEDRWIGAVRSAILLACGSVTIVDWSMFTNVK